MESTKDREVTEITKDRSILTMNYCFKMKGFALLAFTEFKIIFNVYEFVLFRR